MTDQRNKETARCFSCEAPVAAGCGYMRKYKVERDGFDQSTDVVQCEICKILGIAVKPATEIRHSLTEILKLVEED